MLPSKVLSQSSWFNIYIDFPNLHSEKDLNWILFYKEFEFIRIILKHRKFELWSVISGSTTLDVKSWNWLINMWSTLLGTPHYYPAEESAENLVDFVITGKIYDKVVIKFEQNELIFKINIHITPHNHHDTVTYNGLIRSASSLVVKVSWESEWGLQIPTMIRIFLFNFTHQ